jgi:hypothetical protein
VFLLDTQEAGRYVIAGYAGCEGSPRKSLRTITQETGIPYNTCQRAAKKRETAPLSCVHNPNVAANGFGETCTILFMVPTLSWETSWDFGNYYMVYK